MFHDHSKTSIAQIVFYVPATMMAAYLAYHRHQRARMALLILLFSSISQSPLETQPLSSKSYFSS
ncbi:hypothetical protein BDV41DRAFT_526751 [Aspergillus transmontanensis]|uniref:Uncharacterized protein n=1 Tax=Aspergillus transmontanensis TaxID=1034304 RepID=A0A5N6W972_9EURO|nr:hypothetical protein BDV41DRAFT_526751 [Aspergillus transmontanensis]